MRLLAAFLFGLLTFPVKAQQYREFGLGYTYMAPMGPMQPYIRQGHGITLDYYVKPRKHPLAYGIELMITEYGFDRTQQAYSFGNGITMPMDIVVSNSITSLMAGTRYNLRQEGRLMPFVTGKIGYAWFTTSLNIYDPNALDDCAPIDSELLLRDGTFVFSPGGGLQYDLSGIFRKMRPDKFLFTLNANLILGRQVNYMNADAPEHHQPNATDVTARFINTQTQVVHPHHVGNVYQSYMQMMDFRAGFIFRHSK
ncbi:MAG: hypothetical protein MUE95_10640 [Cyclobacteriaceae bacterium]|jgi:hypothetical protein|nr:hypothetical protein [Cyclobacteriaceae bacterium]